MNSALRILKITMKISKLLPALFIASVMIMSGCYNDEPQPLVTLPENADQDHERNSASGGLASDFMGSASGFSVLAATTITNDGASVISTNVGVSPGTAITGFQPSPINTIEGPGTVTAGLGEVGGTIYAGGLVAAAAHQDAVSAYDHLLCISQLAPHRVAVDFAAVTLPGFYCNHTGSERRNFSSRRSLFCFTPLIITPYVAKWLVADMNITNQ